MITTAVILDLVLWTVLVIGALGIDMDVSAPNLAAATFSVMLLGLTFGTLAFAGGCFTGNRRSSVAVIAAVAVAT